MNQVIIHAGFHKTATTSIQKTCARNQDKLEKLGFNYPLFYLNNRVIDNHSIPLYTLFASHPDNYHINIRWAVDISEANQQYEQQLNDILEKKCQKIILSGEDISHFTELEFSRMLNKIYSYGYDVRVIVFVRSPFSYLSSSIQEEVKTGLPIEKVNYRHTINEIQKISSVFPEAEFFSFQEACKHSHGPIGYFLNLINIDDFSDLEFCDSNISMSNQAIRLISYINQEQPLIIENQINPFRCNGDIKHFYRIKGEKFRLNHHELEKFQNEIDKENEFLAEKYGVSFCDQKPYLLSENNDWSEQQLEQLKIVISKIDNQNLTMIAYDYFKNKIHLDKQKVSEIFFHKI